MSEQAYQYRVVWKIRDSADAQRYAKTYTTLRGALNWRNGLVGAAVAEAQRRPVGEWETVPGVGE